MCDELRAAIENAYAVFPEMKWRGRIATVCPCCVSDLNARDLAKTPRRELTADLVSEYLGSAHHVDEGSAAQEVRHFLPRIFEFLAEGEEVSLSGNECALIRLGHGALGWGEETYRDVWPKKEIEAVDRVLRAYWLAVLVEAPELFQRRETGEMLFDDRLAEDALCMVAKGGGDVADLLALWDEDMSLAAALHVANLVSNAMLRSWRPAALLEEGRLGNPHWEEQEDAMRIVVDWLLRPAQCKRLLDAFMQAPQNSPESVALAEAHDEVERVLALRAPGACARSQRK